MSKRVSHSMLDPFLTPRVPALYRMMHIPRRFPPEGIVIIGHLIAIAGAVGFAFSTRTWWGGLLLAAGVAGNHLADMVDGTHARTTGQCRNGGELLDHFTDPLSFSYWMIGWAVSVDNLAMGLAAVVIIYATAVLTSIRAKLVGRFTLARFGPTEMKAILTLYGLAMAALVGGLAERIGVEPGAAAFWFFAAMIVVGVVQLGVNLVLGVIDVNRHGQTPDSTPWELTGVKDGSVQSSSSAMAEEPPRNE